MKFGRVLLSVLGGAAALFIASAPLRASGDFGCYPAWKLASTSYDCAGRAVLTPGNDSRLNLFLLLRSLAGTSDAGLTYPVHD